MFDNIEKLEKSKVDENTLILEGFGCHSEDVKTLVEQIYKDMKIKKNIVIAKTTKEGNPYENKHIYNQFLLGAVVVANSNHNSHDYGNQPALIVNKKDLVYKLVKPDGSIGNYITSDVRPATEKEIRTFIYGLPEGTVIIF